MTAPEAELMKAIASADIAENITLTVADLKYYLRMALMDTMSDTVCNALGGIMGLIFLKVFPYRHRGKNDLNKIIAENPDRKSYEKEKVSA